MYNTQYQYTHDIDWFFLIGNKPIHCASNGGRVPNIYRAVDLQNLQFTVESIQPSHHYVINQASVEQHVSEHYRNIDEGILRGQGLPELAKGIEYEENTPIWMKAYSWSFVKMAQRGFMSFDRDAKTGLYFLVASPADGAESLGNLRELMFKLPEQECPFFKKLNEKDGSSEQINFVSTIERYVRERGKREASDQ